MKTVAKRVGNQTYNFDGQPLMLREKSAAKLIGVSISFLRKSRSQGALKHQTPAPPYVSVGGCVFYRVDDLVAWVTNLTSKRVIT